MKSLKPLARLFNAWHGLIDEPRDSFMDQRTLLSAIKVETIFDVGAYLGDTVNKYASLFPEATVYAFEPFPDLFHELQARFRENTMIKPIQAAVSSIDGQKLFYITRHSATHSLLTPAADAARWMYPDADENAIKVRDKIEVSVMKIDSFCKREDIGGIQVLKMDVQGGELMVLQGAKEKLRQGSIPLVYTEMLFVPIYTGQAYYRDICNSLSEYGYSLFNIYNCAYSKNGRLKWCDAIFISPKI